MKYENSYYSGDESVVIRFSCPSLSSLSWCVKLYSLVLASLGLFISFLWVCFQLYVLSHTTSQELRVLRYFDIFLGVILIISMSCLLYGGYFYSQISITAFITTSLGVMITYWCLFTYFSYNNDDLPLYDDQAGSIGLLLTVLFLLLLLPVLLQYRLLEKEPDQQTRNDDTWPHRRRPPPKYSECFQHPQPVSLA